MANTPTTDKEKALLMALDMEKRGKEDRLPYMLIIYCPESGEWVRCSDGIRGNPEACLFFGQVSTDYLITVAKR